MAEAPVRKGRTPRQARARATVDAILVAAAHILRSDGVAGMTASNRIARTGQRPNRLSMGSSPTEAGSLRRPNIGALATG